MEKKSQIMVSVVLLAYMRENMIRKALDSIVTQQTIYPFEVIVGENHSSDNTLAICREYESMYDNVRVLAHEQNIGAQANMTKCLKSCTGKYIMHCCDDDWWHNPLKIQMQVDYMEAHPECVLCHTDYDIYDESTGKTMPDHDKTHGVVKKDGDIQKEIFLGQVPIAFISACYRRIVFEEHVPIDKFLELGVVGGDYAMWVVIAAYGKVKYLPVSTATYRIGNVSVTREVNYNRIIERREANKRMVKFLYDMFPGLGTYHDDEFFDDSYSHQLLMAAYRANDYSSARKFAKEDKMPTLATRMAHTWLTFKITRLLKHF